MSQETILVTGINGYIGAHIGLQLLQKGYTVRGTSRSATAKDQLLSEAYVGHEDRYHHHVVPDITAPGAFDSAVKDVHAIIHVASPVDFSLTDVESFIGPAVGGVTSILNSSLHAGPQLRSFVLTSSVVAMMDVTRPKTHVYDVNDWNESAEPLARKDFHPGLSYAASKAAAEKAFWKWRDDHHPTFALAAVNPALVFGAPAVWPATPDKLNESLMVPWKIFSGQAKTIPPPIGSGMVIDVRDVAAMHIWCAEHPDEADGQRFPTVSGLLPPQAIADVLRAAYADREITKGIPGEGYVPESWGFVQGGIVVDKMYAALGGKDKIIPPDRMLLDTFSAFEKRWPDAAKNKIHVT